jgi:membrane protease YdiL (CAAX protease family)
LIGTTHYQWGLGSAFFWIFFLSVIPLSIFMAWAYAQNNRSILAAILIHFVFNFSLSLVYPISARVFLFWTIFQGLLAVGVVIFMPKTETQLASEATP